jgi:secondary thiamine-phosphate synthase enzyme
MKTLLISTNQKREIINITDKIQDLVTESKIENGICHLFVLHTTAALTIADLDPGTDLDMLDAFEKIIPKLKYRHPHDPGHVADHILSSIIGVSLPIFFVKKVLILGNWQNIVLAELNGPKKRKIIYSFQPLT